MRERTLHQMRVELFMTKAGQVVPNSPAVPDVDVRVLRAKLVLEEALELIEALGMEVRVNRDQYSINNHDLKKGRIHILPVLEPDLVQIADGCADLSVVNTGTLSACGIADEGLMELVDDNNLAKFGPGGHRREDGKWIKPPDHKPPAIMELLEKQILFVHGPKQELLRPLEGPGSVNE